MEIFTLHLTRLDWISAELEMKIKLFWRFTCNLISQRRLSRVVDHFHDFAAVGERDQQDLDEGELQQQPRVFMID
jgi:hypothetical protein